MMLKIPNETFLWITQYPQSFFKKVSQGYSKEGVSCTDNMVPNYNSVKL